MNARVQFAAAGLLVVVCVAVGLPLAAGDNPAGDPRGDVERTKFVPVPITATATVTVKPKPRPTATVTRRVVQRASRSNTRVAPPAGSSSSVWARLAECESGGRLHAVGGGGAYHGLYQLALGWYRHHDIDPWESTAGQQLRIARYVLDRQGWGAWPVCSVRIGVR